MKTSPPCHDSGRRRLGWTLGAVVTTALLTGCGRNAPPAFRPNPVAAGHTVAATLPLASKTRVDATIVTSDTSGITPEHDTCTIPAGQDSLTLNVLTGAQGCQPQSATTSAFSADGQNAVLTVHPPPNCRTAHMSAALTRLEQDALKAAGPGGIPGPAMTAVDHERTWRAPR